MAGDYYDKSSYPPEWQCLQYPWMRAELIDELKALADTEYLWNAWVRRTVDQHLVIGFNETIHFFFDDHGFEHPQSEIGYSLLSAEEAEALRR